MKTLKFNEKLAGLRGFWTLDVYEGDISKDASGRILNKQVDKIEGENLITTDGKEMIMDRLFGLSAVGAMTRIGVGTSSTSAAVGNTSLTGSSYKAFDSTPTRAGLVVTCSATYGTGDGNLEWNELGMDNGTTLLNRIAPIGPFNKTSALSVIVTVKLTQS